MRSQAEDPDPLPAADEAYREVLVPAGAFLLSFVAVYAVGQLLVRPAVVRGVRRRNPNNPTLTDAISRYVSVVVYVVALAVAAAAAGYGHVLTGSSLIVAALTVALGVAGQDVIGNLISGVFLVADRSINVGDRVEWTDRAGVIEAISLRVTRVRTASNEIITVPNAELATNAVTLPYGRDRYRIAVTVEVARSADLDAAIAILVETAERGWALDEPAPSVRAVDLDSGAISLETLFWVADPDQPTVRRARSAFTRRVHERFAEAGIEIRDPDDRELTGHLDVTADRDRTP